MSFQYTAPPQEITQAGQTATYLLYASLILVLKTRWAALIGGLGSATITYIVAGYAKGDMNALSYIIGARSRVPQSGLLWRSGAS